MPVFISAKYLENPGSWPSHDQVGCLVDLLVAVGCEVELIPFNRRGGGAPSSALPK